ncbi:class I SAM-dependent methyltransferase [Aminipila terrae]|nr:class I SAM-dependent methyltransferase [Aminipila terrae]
MDYLKEKPLLYAPSSSEFWDDQYISQNMLEAHLNPDFDGASRKHRVIQQSASWIAALVESAPGKKLLDLGCGPGIYAELFKDHGFRVTGIDFSRRSINYAKQAAESRNKEIEYLCENYLNLDYQEQFDIVTLIYCDFGVLNPEDRHMLLCKIKKALKPGGILLFDGFTKSQLSLWGENQKIEYCDSGFWSPLPYVCLKRNIYYEADQVFLEQYIVVTENECHCYNMWNQIFSKDSLLKELKQAGFNKVQFFDDVCGSPFSGENNTICAVAR